MKAVHTVASVDDEATGPSYSVPSLVAALARAGHDAEVAALGDGSRRTQLGARVVTLPRDKVWPQPLMRLGRSKAMRFHLLDSGADVFHAHGLWMMPCVYPADAARALNVPLVLAPRGMLGRDALAFSKNTKRTFWAALQKRACERVNCFHATAESELEDIRAFGLKQPVAVIPNGIDLPDLAALGPASRPETQAPFILSLGRVHPKKGLNRLIAGFAQMADAFPRHRLRIIGPDEGGHAADLMAQAHQLGLGDRISVEPPLFGDDKFRTMQQADVFALSTLHENFAMTVAESLAVGTPVISTKGAPWRGLEEHRCGWWIDHGPESMAAALEQALSMPTDDRDLMGQRGRDWMERDFAWDGIAAKMTAVYEWLLSGSGERAPMFVC